MFGPLVRDVCSNASGALSNAQVRTAGVLALCKLMCVSAEYCEENLQVYAFVGVDVDVGERERE
jgi:condensin complex subunit 1